MKIPLDRRREVAAGVVFGFVVAAFVLAFFQGALPPEYIEGRYYSNDRGQLSEITRREWLHLHSLESRMFAGHVMAFGVLALLYLTQPRTGRSTDEPVTRQNEPVTRPHPSGETMVDRPVTGHSHRRSTT